MLEKPIEKKIIKSVYSFLILLIILPNLKLHGQCAPGALSRDCINTISDGFIYLKSYSIDGQDNTKDKIEYTAVMSKDTQYAFKICTSDAGADGIVLTIYDSKRNEIISNQRESVIDPELDYSCTSTGIYYLRFTFYESRNRCAGCILSFKKNQD